MIRELYSWQIEKGPRVSLVSDRDGARIIITDRGVRLCVWPNQAVQIASAVDECMKRIDRNGNAR